MRRSVVLVLAALTACAPAGPPPRNSAALVVADERLPEGYLEDFRGDEPLIAVLRPTGETALEDLSGTVAPPIPGQERAPLRAVRRADDGAVWACTDDTVALYDAGHWRQHDFASFGVAGPCTSLDARSASDVYVGVGSNVCAWDGLTWDCFLFGPTAAITLSGDHLWFVRTSAHFDDLEVIDTVSRATPGLVRLGDAGSTRSLVPVRGAEAVFVETEMGIRRATPEGGLTAADARSIVPLGGDEQFVLRVLAAGEVVCAGLTCGAGDEWSQLVVLHQMGAVTTEVGHVTSVGPDGVPWRGFLRTGGALRVRTAVGLLLALP